jgi:PKD repeat protein
MNWVRSGLLVVVSVFGLAGFFGTINEDALSGLNTIPTVVPPPGIPRPVVSINDRGVGFAAYAQNGSVIVRRFEGATGFSEPVTVASDVQENDIDAVVGGSRARVAWRGRGGRVSVRNGDIETGEWQDGQIDVAASFAADPVFANGQHSSISRTFVAWRGSELSTNGLMLTRGFGTLSLLAPYLVLSRYAEDVAGIPPVFDLRVATGGQNTIAVWTAGGASTDSSTTRVYVSLGNGAVWGEAQSLTEATGGIGAPAIDMDENGNAMLVWPQSDGVFLRRYVAASSSWTPVTIVRSETSIAREVQIDVAPNGQAVVAWVSGNNAGLWSAVGNVSSDTWTDLQRIDFDGENALNGREPRVALDRQGRAIVVWRIEDRLNASEHHADGWRPSVPLGPTQSAADLDLNDAGLGVAVWWNDGLQSRTWSALGPLAASFTYSPELGIAGLGLLFNAQESSGPFPVTSYDWDWEDDGTFEEDRGAVHSHAFETPGTYTTRLRITDSAGQVAETTRSVNVVGVGEVSSQVIVNYMGPGDGALEIHSTQPGFATVRCSTATPPAGPTDMGTCSATVLGGYAITIVAEYDPVRSTFSGWPEGFRQCSSVATTTAGVTRAECHFTAIALDRTFDVTFQIAPPATEILRVQLSQFSLGGGQISSRPTSIVNCRVVDGELRSFPTGGNCAFSIDPATTPTLTLIAEPLSGVFFRGWQGCDPVPPPTSECTVTINGPRTLTLTFALD